MLTSMRFAPHAMVLSWGSLLVSGCSHSPPPNWASGGIPLAIQAASWERADDDPIQIGADGKIREGDDVVFEVDRAGRVYEKDGDSKAILLPDGNLVGKDDAGLGVVGPVSAAFPGSPNAWVSLGPDGEVIRYDEDGERVADGRWRGCGGPMLRTCTLVTHLVLLREWRRRPSVGVGVGVGVGFPIR